MDNGLGYPVNVNGTWVDQGTGAYNLDARQALYDQFAQGGTQQPVLKGIGDSIGQQYATQLNPRGIMTYDSQGPDPSLLMLQNPLGCNVATGKEYLATTPLYTSQPSDIYGLPIYGGPFSGMWLQTTESQPGNVQVIGGLSDDPHKKKKIPMFGLYMGDAMGQKQYGEYEWTDPVTGKKYKNLGKEDPVVNKPEVNWLFNPEQFFLDKQNRANLTTHGGIGSAYGAGTNIQFMPGVPPDKQIAVTVGSGGSVTPGSRQLAFSWTYAKANGTTVDSALSPLSYVNCITGQQTINGSIPPTALDNALLATAVGIKVWSTKVGETAGAMYLADTIPGLNTGTTTITFALTAADAALGAAHVDVQTLIEVTPTVELIGDVPDGTHTHTPRGTLSLGHWASKTDLSAFTYDGGNTGAHEFFALDEDHKADLAIAYGRATGEGAITPSLMNETADWTKSDAASHSPVISKRTNGVVRADGGVQTIYLDHSPPTDADVPWPAAWGAMGNALIAICSNDNSLWWRSDNLWHTDDDAGCPSCLVGSSCGATPTNPDGSPITTTANGSTSTAGGAGNLQPSGGGALVADPGGTTSSPPIGAPTDSCGTPQGYTASGAKVTEITGWTLEGRCSLAGDGLATTAHPTFHDSLSYVHVPILNVPFFALYKLRVEHPTAGDWLVSHGIDDRAAESAGYDIWGFRTASDSSTLLDVDNNNGTRADPMGTAVNNWFGVYHDNCGVTRLFQGPSADHLTEVWNTSGNPGPTGGVFAHGDLQIGFHGYWNSPNGTTPLEATVVNFHVYDGLPSFITWTDLGSTVHGATTTPPTLLSGATAAPADGSQPSIPQGSNYTVWKAGYDAEFANQPQSSNPYYGLDDSYASYWNQGWVDAWNAQHGSPGHLMPGGSGTGTGGSTDGVASSTTTTAPAGNVPNGTVTTTNSDGSITTAVTTGGTLSGGTWSGGTTTSTTTSGTGSSGSCSTAPIPIQGTMNVAADVNVGGTGTFSDGLTVGSTNAGTLGTTSGTSITPTTIAAPSATITGTAGLTVNTTITQAVLSGTPTTPNTGNGIIYLQNVSGTPMPTYMGSDGVAHSLLGSGTVTSVALSLPALFTVSGSPVTTSGALTAALATQTANTVFAGPTTGSAAAPGFRVLVAADIPALDAAKITSGTLAVARLPLGTTGAPGALQPDGTTITVSGGVISVVGGGGTSTSVGEMLVADGTTNPPVGIWNEAGDDFLFSS